MLEKDEGYIYKCVVGTVSDICKIRITRIFMID